MANSGTIQTEKMAGTNLRIKMDWSISNVDVSAGTANFNYKLYGYSDTDSGTQYMAKGTGDRNYCNVNGSSIYYISTTGTGTYQNPYLMYSKESKHRDKSNPKYASTDTGYDFNGYIYIYGILAQGSRQIQYDDDGNTSISINGAFQCLYGAATDKRVWLTTIIVPDRIERYSRSQSSNNSGSNWSKNKFAYKTTDYGQTWTKCNLYKTTNNGSNWDKISS